MSISFFKYEKLSGNLKRGTSVLFLYFEPKYPNRTDVPIPRSRFSTQLSSAPFPKDTLHELWGKNRGFLFSSLLVALLAPYAYISGLRFQKDTDFIIAADFCDQFTQIGFHIGEEIRVHSPFEDVAGKHR